MISAKYAYVIYTSVRLHFNPSSNYYLGDYGYLKKCHTGFDKSKNQRLFRTLAKRYPKENDLRDFLIANFLEKDFPWIGILLGDPDAEKRYLSWIGRTRNVEDTFTKDSRTICETVIRKDLSFAKEFPEYVLECMMNREISLESFIIFTEIFRKKFKNTLDNSILYEYNYRNKIDAYRRIFSIGNLSKYRQIFENIFRKEYMHWKPELKTSNKPSQKRVTNE